MTRASRSLLLASLIAASLSTQTAHGAIDGPLISLPEARSRALASSPELEVARSVAVAAGGALRQARAWANPEVGFDAEEVGGDRPGRDEAEVTWTLSQRLELFGTRSARTRAALHGRDAAVLSADAARLDLLAEVDRRFAQALVAQSRIEAFESSDSIAVETVRAVSALVEAGEVSPIELDRAEAERSQVTTRLLAVRFEHVSAVRSLAQLWGSHEPDFSGVRGSLDITPPLPDRDSLLAAAPELPDLRAADAEVRRVEAEAVLAGRERLPEVVVRGGVRRFNASDEFSFVGGLGLSLPLFDRMGGKRDEARARVNQARAQRVAMQSRIGLARATAYDALAVALETSRSLRVVSLPRAQAVHTSVQEGYRRGKFGLLDVIDARRFLLQTRLEYIEALRSVWTARADLARLVSQDMVPGEGESQ